MKQKIKEEKINKKKFKKILNDSEEKDFDEFIIIDTEFELANKELPNKE